LISGRKIAFEMQRESAVCNRRLKACRFETYTFCFALTLQTTDTGIFIYE